MIELKRVSIVRGRETMFENVNARFEPGETVAIVGESGSGKSLLLRLMLGLEKPASGSIEIDGVDLRKIPKPIMELLRRRVGFVFSDLKLFPERTVKENLGYALEIAGATQQNIERRTADLVKELRLGDRANELPSLLSRGEQARVALGRAVAAAPLILLLDDPFRMIDRSDLPQFLALLKKLKTPETTLIAATSEPEIALLLGGRVLQIRERSLQMLHTEVSEPGRTSRSQHAGAPALEKEESTLPLPVLSHAKPRHGKAEGPRKIKVTGIGS